MDNNKSNQELKTGDTVQLKSGGPPMTIIKVEDEEAYCKWFKGEYHDKVDSGHFPFNSLQLVVVKPHKKGTAKGNF